MSIVPAKVCQTLGLDAEFVGARIRLQFRGPVRWQGDFEARNTVSVPSTNALQVRLKGGQQRRSLDAVIGKAYVVVPCRGERLHRDNVRPHLAVGSGPGPFGRRGLFWMGRDTAFGLWRAGDEDALALIAFALPAAVDAVAAVWPLVAALPVVSEGFWPPNVGDETHLDPSPATGLATFVLARDANHTASVYYNRVDAGVVHMQTECLGLEEVIGSDGLPPRHVVPALWALYTFADDSSLPLPPVPHPLISPRGTGDVSFGPFLTTPQAMA